MALLKIIFSRQINISFEYDEIVHHTLHALHCGMNLEVFVILLVFKKLYSSDFFFPSFVITI